MFGAKLRTGVRVDWKPVEVVPSPNWPESSFPQHQTAALEVSKHVLAYPTETAATDTPPGTPDNLIGTSEGVDEE